MEDKLQDIRQGLNNVSINTPEVGTYKDATIRQTACICHETLDIIKSLPDFEGIHETYISWRNAAHVAYKVFEKYEDSLNTTRPWKYKETKLRVRQT